MSLYINTTTVLKKLAITFFSIVLFALQAKATHIYGGELLYTYISGNTYKVSLTIYGDCAGSAFPLLGSGAPIIEVYESNMQTSTLTLNQEFGNSNIEVTPVCAQDSNNTACKTPPGTIPGVKKFVFSNTISLTPSPSWRLVFAGQLGNNHIAGRSQNITNISTSNGQVMYIEAFLNNQNGHNSSPQYTTIPTPFYCINLPQQYNQGAIDPNSDSLSFELVPALVNGLPTAYLVPYSLF